MIKNNYCLIFSLLVFCLIPQSAFAYSVGIKTISYYDQARERNLSTLIYYPTDSTVAKVLVKRNNIFEGYYAIPEAPIADGKFPLMIISRQ